MSLTDALNTAASGLYAQSAAISSISSNISNSSTVGYKTTSTEFDSLVYSSNSAGSSSSGTGGVTSTTYRNISYQGDIQSSDTETNLAISGDGYFVVTDDSISGSTYYTRDGTFSADEDGNLVNESGYYLQGYAISDGAAASTLTTVNLSDIQGTAKATTEVALEANLPADAANGASVTSDVEVYDSLGNASTVEMTWTKAGSSTELEDGSASWDYALDSNAASVTLTVTDADGNAVYTTTGDTSSGTHTLDWNGVGTDGTAYSDGTYKLTVTATDASGNAVGTTTYGENTWTLTAANPVSSSGTETGTVSGLPTEINFSSDGSLADTATSPSLSITGWTDGATDSTVTLNLGTAGSTDGLTQYATGDDDPDISVEGVSQDGYEAGTLTDTSIDENGIVTATFSNGETRSIYQVPVATFTNADGLSSVTGSVFAQTSDAGTLTLNTASENGSGSIVSSAVESSTTDLTDEYSRMITAQQAYNAASKVVTTTDSMLQTTIELKD